VDSAYVEVSFLPVYSGTETLSTSTVNNRRHRPAWRHLSITIYSVRRLLFSYQKLSVSNHRSRWPTIVMKNWRNTKLLSCLYKYGDATTRTLQTVGTTFSSSSVRWAINIYILLFHNDTLSDYAIKYVILRQTKIYFLNVYLRHDF